SGEFSDRLYIRPSEHPVTVLWFNTVTVCEQDKPVRRRPPRSLQLPKTHGDDQEPPGVTSPLPAKTKRNSALIEKLQASLALSPSTQLPSPKSPGFRLLPPAFTPPSPGSAPVTTVTTLSTATPTSPVAATPGTEEEGPISFEAPPTVAEGSVLSSINKGRVRHSIRRRPPSRRHRKSSSGDDAGVTNDVTDKTTAGGEEGGGGGGGGGEVFKKEETTDASTCPEENQSQKEDQTKEEPREEEEEKKEEEEEKKEDEKEEEEKKKEEKEVEKKKEEEKEEEEKDRSSSGNKEEQERNSAEEQTEDVTEAATNTESKEGKSEVSHSAFQSKSPAAWFLFILLTVLVL
uniref:Duboraya n=1 Tax=Lates calcarifer TaxID=8187 RepID=A0A4W6FAT4_LATCA